MSKEVSTKEINAGFLAIVLIAGTLAAISPSFMIGAHAQQYGMDQKYNSYEPDYGMDIYDDKQSYGKDHSYDKSKDSVIVKKIKCNNINVNLNGLEIDALPTALDGLATEAQADEGEIGASSFGSGGGSNGGGPSGSDSDSRFVCINNNDNTAENGDETDPCGDAIEACFRQVLLDFLFPNFVEALESEAGITVEINGQDITLRSFEDICLALEGLTFAQLTIAIGDIIAGAEIELTAPSLSRLIQCIAEALDIPIPPR